jgi:hypothetical protein
METEIRAKRGRPKGSGKITEAVINKICDGIVRGMTIEGAASEAGIGSTTLYVWLDKSKVAQRGIYRDLRDKWEAAKARAKNLLENKLHSLALGYTYEKEAFHPKTGEIVILKEKKVSESAIKFILERRHAEEWGRKDKLDLTNDGDPFNVPMFGAVMGEGEDDEDAE